MGAPGLRVGRGVLAMSKVTTIICLGGNVNRAIKAAEVALSVPGSRIIVSSEGNPALVAEIFTNHGVDLSRVYFDFKAWDTVTNFTHTKQLVRKFNTSHLIVVTDKLHVKRSMAIARSFYYPTLKITPEFLNVSWNRKDSSVIRDVIRTLVYRFTGILITGGGVKSARMPDILKDEQIARDLGLLRE